MQKENDDETLTSIYIDDMTAALKTKSGFPHLF